jgi:hypothetical protein
MLPCQTFIDKATNTSRERERVGVEIQKRNDRGPKSNPKHYQNLGL